MSLRPIPTLIACAMACSMQAAVVGSGDNIPHFELNWSDEFNQGYADTGYPLNNAPNPAVWNKDAWGSDGGQPYDDGQINYINFETRQDYERQVFMGRPENLRVEGGNLVLELRADRAQGVGFRDQAGNINDLHTSGIVQNRLDGTKPGFAQTSRIEFRAKIPHQPAVWPALWMLGDHELWPNCGEIDVLEYWGSETSAPFGYTATTNIHWSDPDYPGGHGENMQFYSMRRPSDAFHIYAVERDQEKILMFLDDVLIAWRSITRPAQSELRDRDATVIMNFCYTGTDPALDQVQMQVDYVREYFFKPGVRRHYPPTVAAGWHENGLPLRAYTNQPLPIAGRIAGDGMPGQGYTHEWELLGGPGVGVFADASALETTVTFPVAGTYAIRLTGHDGQYGNTDMRTIEVVDGSGNTAPSIVSPHRTVLAGHPVRLQATVVDDGLPGGGTSVTWGTAGTPPVTFSSTSVLEPTVTFGASGNYMLTATASDGALSSTLTMVRFTVVDGTNQAPQVATGAPLNINLGDTVTLSGTVSDDGLPEYSTTQVWTQISGPAPARFAQPTWVRTPATFTTGGTYVLRLTATDGSLSAFSELTVNVSNTGNHVPAISTVGPVALDCTEGGSATVGLAATDGDSDPLTWSVITPAGHGTAAVNASGLVTYTPTAGYLGTDRCVIQVADSHGATDAITINISVTTTRPDVFGLTASPIHVATVGDAIGLSASVRPGTGHSIDRVVFSIGGTTLGNGVFNGVTWNLPYTTTIPGATTITVTAYGDDNQTSTRTVVVTAVTNGTYGNGGAPWQVPASGTLRLEVENFDQGGEGVAYHDDNLRQGTNASRDPATVDLETLSPSGIDIGYIAAGEWLRYSLNVVAAGTYDLRFHVSNGGAPAVGAITLLWKGASVAGPVTVPATGDYSVFTDVVVPGVTLAGGSGMLELACNTGGFNIDWIEFTSTVVGGNAAPTVNAGADQTITLPATATLSGSATDDGLPAGSSLSYLWTKSTGPGTVTFGSSTSAGTTASFSAAGTYVLQLAVSDTELSRTDTITVTVNPVVVTSGTYGNGGANWLVPASGTLRLQVENFDIGGEGVAYHDDGMRQGTNASRDPEGVDLEDLAGGGIDIGYTAAGEWLRYSLTVATSGSYDLRFRVSNGNGIAATNAFTLLWQGASVAGPVSVPPTGDWGMFTEVVVSGVTLASGSGTLELACNTGGFNVDWIEFTATAVGANVAPTVNAGANQSITLPATATLSGSASDDGLPAGSSLSYLWSKSTGPGTVTFGSSTSAGTTASFSAAGTYVLQLAASDTALSGTDTVTITVNPVVVVNTAPVVSAGADQTITLPATATLSGSASDDGLPAGSSLSHLWTTVSGPGTVTFGSATSAGTTASFSSAGTYVLQLATSDTALSGTDTVTITVNPAVVVNTAPVANAGVDQAITLPATATLSGSATDDGLPAGSSLSYLWTTTSGPGTVTFASATSAGTTASFSVAGTYVLQLAVSDTALSGTDTITITVNPVGTPNTAPVVDAGIDQTITLPATVTLNGLVTDDGQPVGSPLTYQWSMWTGPGTVTFASETSAGTTASFSVAGTYVLELEARDSALEGTDTITITVNPAGTPNVAPVANAGADQTITLPATATLSGSATDDGLPAGSTLSYLWTMTSGSGTVTFGSATSAGTTASFSAVGTYVLQLAASDTALSGTDTITITVNPAVVTNVAPVANAGVDQTITLPATATLSGSATDDGLPAGSSLSYLWTMTSGPGTVTFASATSAGTTASFSAAGTYVLQLAVSDTALSGTDTITITVNAAGTPNVAPVANAGVDQTITLPATATLSGSATDDGLPAGSSLSYLWTMTSGPGTVTFASATSAGTTASFSAAGAYVLQLAVSDTALSGTDTITITVNAAGTPNTAPVVNAGADQSVTLPATATLSGSANDDGLPAGSTLSYQWNGLSGPGVVTFASATSAGTTASFSLAGTYVLQLTVSDSSLSTTDTVTITVTGNSGGGPVTVTSGGSAGGSCGAGGALGLLGLIGLGLMRLRPRSRRN